MEVNTVGHGTRAAEELVETLWVRCHRRLISELLAARGHDVVHLLGPGRSEPHRRWDEAEYRDGRLYLCGALVA